IADRGVVEKGIISLYWKFTEDFDLLPTRTIDERREADQLRAGTYRGEVADALGGGGHELLHSRGTPRGRATLLQSDDVSLPLRRGTTCREHLRLHRRRCLWSLSPTPRRQIGRAHV